MDLQATAQLLGNFGEFVGAIAVVATLMYLAVQIKHSREQTATQNEQSMYQQWQRPPELLAGSAEASQLFVRGQRSRLELADAEVVQFDMILAMGMNGVEFAYRRSNDPENDSDAETWLSVARFWLDSPGGNQFWKDRRDQFYPAFADWIDRRLALTFAHTKSD